MQAESVIEVSCQKFKVSSQCLGSGSFADVYKAENISTSEIVAVKSVSPIYLQQALNELKMLRLLNGEMQHKQNSSDEVPVNQTLKLIGFHRTSNTLQIVTQYYGQALTKVIHSMESYDLQYVLKIFHSILVAMEPLRKQKILHRDIKPDNILIERCFCEGTIQAKICDFGLAILQKQGKPSLFSPDRVGTLISQAPEVLKFKQYSQKSEIWSLGMILYRLIYHKFPYNLQAHPNGESLYQATMSQIIKFPNVPLPIAQLGEKCLLINSNKRIGFKDLVKQFKIIVQNQKGILEDFFNSRVKSNIMKESETCSTAERLSEYISDFTIDEISNGIQIKKQGGDAADAIEFALRDSLIFKLKKVLSEVQKSILSTKKIKREAELTFLSVSQKLLQKTSSQLTQYFSSSMIKALVMNIKKLKLICQYADDEKKIVFNSKQFKLMDLLMVLYDLVLRWKQYGLEDSNNIRKGIQILDEHLNENGAWKSIEYYLELRVKLINFKQ